MSFHLSAQDISMDGPVLRATLANADGEWVEAELNLDAYVGNSWGSFEWGGTNFSETASDLEFNLEPSGEPDEEGNPTDVPILRATLGNGEEEGVAAVLNLAERIGNDNGTLIFCRGAGCRDVMSILADGLPWYREERGPE
ncbi:related to Cyanovirin-N homolog [Cephalotrichum gorgonifer]|uniref:Related to Cyanovirin-N homolog n=1 Tax=Cephalotrichum gorgonifer TaxID=2041049 RepID=A0AAE8N7A2_9PEZI|nr:related to Cyanovirin-N homolog [Cephalotrichum gorgonifer]